MERHLATVWESLADAIGDATALVQGERQISWRRLRRARRAARDRLRGGGARRRARRSRSISTTHRSTARRYFAALKLRAVPVNVNYRYLDDELLHLLEDSESEALVFHASLGDRVERCAPAPARSRC